MQLFHSLLSFLFPSGVNQEDIHTLPYGKDPEENYSYARYNYNDPQTRSIILAIKRYHDPLLFKKLGEALVDEIIDVLSDYQYYNRFTQALVIPIPNSPGKPFNQAAFLAQACVAKIPQASYLNPLFQKEKRIKQAKISGRKARYQNIKGNIAIRKRELTSIINQDIILIDDLTTSGASFFEARQLLKKAGARHVISLALAHPHILGEQA